MDCLKIIELIPQYCTGELDEETCRSFEEHCSACPACRKELEQEQSMRNLMSDGSVEDPPEEYWESYNRNLSSKLRAVGGLLWKLGILPGCLIGLIAGGLATATSFMLFKRPSLVFSPRFILLLAAALAVGLLVRFMFKRASQTIEQRTSPEESSLRKKIADNTTYRIVFLAAISVINVAASLFVGYFWLGMALNRLPRIITYPLVILFFVILMVSSILATNDYLRNASPWWGWKFDRKIKRLQQVLVLLVVGLMFLNIFIDRSVHAPLHDVVSAGDAYDKGQVGQAISMLQGSISRNHGKPWVLDCYQVLAFLYKDTGQENKAKAVLRDGISEYQRMLLHPAFHYTKDDRTTLMKLAAKLHIDIGQKESARELYRLMLVVDPNNPRNIEAVASGLDRAGFHEDARSLYTLMLIKYPDNMWTDFARTFFSEHKR